jgi:dolichol-phosphate mannosyltransferase
MSTAAAAGARQDIELSVVVPVYGCRTCLDALHSRLTNTLRSLVKRHEIVFVDDCSPDDAWSVLVEISRRDPAVKAYRFSRNFGQHAAITAGLEQCGGAWAIVMDCDLQDPPEEIPRLYRMAIEGYDVVFARRKEKRHSLFRRCASWLYFRLMNVFSRSLVDGEVGSFSIISRRVIDAFLQFRDRDRHYLFILNWIGFRSTSIEYEHAERYSGTSSYSLSRLIKHALDGMFFQTTILLRWIVYLGFWVSCSGFMLAAYYIYMYFAHSIYPGYTSLVVLILLIGGVIIMSIGVTGLYIGKIFDQVKGRPLYVIDKTIVNGKPE